MTDLFEWLFGVPEEDESTRKVEIPANEEHEGSVGVPLSDNGWLAGRMAKAFAESAARAQAQATATGQGRPKGYPQRLPPPPWLVRQGQRHRPQSPSSR